MPGKDRTMMGIDQRVVTFLGLRVKTTDGISIHRLICRGIPYRSFERIRNVLNLTHQELSEALGLSQRELRLVRKTSGRLSLVPSDRLYRIARIFVLAFELFREKRAAASWLRSPQIGFGWMTPFDLLLSEPGSQEVEDLLCRIAHGVIS